MSFYERMPVSYYPRDKKDALRCLKFSGRCLDEGDEAMGHIYHRAYRAYRDDHPEEFE
jgi:hypothetical protein